ncbi:MAG TPA: transcriptional regulator GcvA [Parvularculaceae bacterium]|nr:transcriptional regulator GcvA [Parvularculaceae bacterium]
MKSLPPLNALKVFESAARHLSFTKAADELHVTPGAVSQQIKALEDYIGSRLFRRTKRALLLTDAAQASLPILREAFDKLEEAARILMARGDSRRITVSVAPSLAAKWLVPRLDRFHERHPEVEVWISADMEVVDFAVDDVDLAIRYGPGRYPGLEVELLMEETILPVCSPRLLQGEHPLRTPHDLAHHPLLHDGSPDQDDRANTNWAMWLKAAGVCDVDAKRGAKFNQSSLVIEAAVAGKGVALAKQAIALADLEAGRLVAPFDLTTPSSFSYHLVHPASKSRIAAVKAFKKWLHEEAAATGVARPIGQEAPEQEVAAQ